MTKNLIKVHLSPFHAHSHIVLIDCMLLHQILLLKMKFNIIFKILNYWKNDKKLRWMQISFVQLVSQTKMTYNIEMRDIFYLLDPKVLTLYDLIVYN